MPKERLFLERRSYRMRRMMDAVRLLPILGLCLWLEPMMWPVADQGDAGSVATSTALRYIFGIWIFLNVAAWLLWRQTRGIADADVGTDPNGVDKTPAEPH